MKPSGPLRRTELKRDGEGAKKFAQNRGSGLARTGSPLPRSTLKSTSRLAPRSSAREKLYANERRPYIQSLADVGVGCEIGPVFEEVGINSGCTGRLEGLHERRKRSSGGSLVHHDNLIPACNRCNGYVEDEPDEVRLLTGSLLVLREGDPEWERLGSRHDREID